VWFLAGIRLSLVISVTVWCRLIECPSAEEVSFNLTRISLEQLLVQPIHREDAQDRFPFEPRSFYPADSRLSSLDVVKCVERLNEGCSCSKAEAGNRKKQGPGLRLN
jgi:hypothetical protein